MIKKIYKYSLVIILSFIFCVGFSPQALSQIPFVPSFNTTNTMLPETPAWDLNRARACGRSLCSDVFFYGNRNLRINTRLLSAFRKDMLIVASPRSIDRPIQEVAFEVEQRARSIQNIFRQIFESMADSGEIGKLPQQKLQFWLSTKRKPLHPLTPVVDIGVENNQKVIFIAAKPELNITQQTLITVTRVDARANNQTIDDLAERWRRIVIKALSEALWGLEMDRQQPLLRIQISLVTVAIALLCILIIKFFAKLAYKWRRNLSNKLKEIQKSLLVDPEAKPVERNYTSESGEIGDSVQNNPFQNMFDNGKKMFFEGISFSAKLIPSLVLKKQNIIRQQINISELISSLLFLSQFTIVLFTISSIAFTYRETRFLFNLFLIQAVLLPVIWILMILTDKFVDFWIDYALNRWAKEKQELEPESNRANLRVNTYSPALRGATTFIFGAIAVFMSLSVVGLSPNVLAGAGAVAVVFAFLSRNLLEDMLNGILILITDRYAVGDVVEINGLGGFVESMNLYTTSLRDLDGNLKVIPNGKIFTVINATKDWSRVNFTVEINWDADIKKTINILQNVADQMYRDSYWHEKMLSSAEILGIDKINHEGIMIRLLIKTKPIQQWDVGREYRWRVKEAFDLAGIRTGVPQTEIIHRHEENNNSLKLSANGKNFWSN
ncbi:mechanosensitive ion channel family protein [Cyanobacterium aponinum UTEX 3221]|uniref:mechanosensitive ion channel family protein n=1 Tax=Cyanobacterium aponinum TaxID=379064 RepID=UPI002B4BC7CD|nr:mechanosensitive ion channel family protein [Cyanobacterium aponinum]WRL37975.1 mechanosensitive ion channel family protein [Cyanobacterium aponinum UTEX 3221]